MKKDIHGLLRLGFGLLSLISFSATAALVEYRGSKSMVIDGVERNVALSLTIDNEFPLFHATLQHMYDNYPPSAHVDEYYGGFDIHNSSLNIEGAAPITGSGGTFFVWVTDIVSTGSGYDFDISALQLFTEDVVTDWSQHSRIQFLEDSGEPYRWDSWWGDSPTNDLPALMGVTRLDVMGAGEYSGWYNLAADPLLLRPVPLPAAAWLFSCGLMSLLGVVRRNKRR